MLASGGRYDALIKTFQNPLINRRRADGEPIKQPTVVGAVIHVERLATILKENENVDRRIHVDAAVCTVGHRPQTKEQAALVKDLWNNGIRATILDHCQVSSFRKTNINFFFNPHANLLRYRA